MKTEHKLIFEDARNMKKVENESIDLMITSPPYPMIKMWDEMFGEQNEGIKRALNNKKGEEAFELMHKELDKVWKEVYRTLKKGGWACINIGDATRKINDSFKLYSNHSRVLSSCMSMGFDVLPEIIWRKPSNKPNKFMGSGTLPAGAYVSQEHEYILILRKGGKREFNSEEEKLNRQKSAYFFEERNRWFSDIWTDVRGDKQILKGDSLRERSAAFPFELAYRLINMYSIQGDYVLDPFLGTGTTTLAAMASARNSVGVEIDRNFFDFIKEKVNKIVEIGNRYNKKRIINHKKFIEEREEQKGEKVKYENHEFPVVSRQETKIDIPKIRSVTQISNNIFNVEYY